MTEASKARRRVGYGGTRLENALIGADRAMPGFAKKWIRTQSNSIRVTATGISCRAGVGGRRGRKRRVAAMRFRVQHPYQWLMGRLGLSAVDAGKAIVRGMVRGIVGHGR